MKSFIAKPQEVERKWYVVDAEGKTLGRLASEVAMILRGKRKPIYTPHVDCGEFVVIINCDKAVLTGRKLDQKFHRTHSGYIGGLKETSYRKLMQTKPEFAMRLAVKGMLPKNSIGDKAITRLFAYSGSEHKQQAQKPQPYEVEI